MELISIHALQNLGISIIHSLWQIAIITFIYFFFILTRKKLSVNHKYTFGLVSFAIILASFIFTFHLVENQNSYEISVKSDNSVLNISNELLSTNLPEKEVIQTQDNIPLFAFTYYKFWTVINQVAGAIGGIWILGLIFFIFRKILAYYNLKSIKNNKYNVRSIKWEKTLREISSKLNLRRQVDILFSPFVNSPLSFGFLKPVILFPLRITTGLSTEEIKCILIHELAHNLRNDYLYNIFQHVIETLFFYHPGIWWMSKNIRTQREIICDKIVLDNKISKKYYVNTLLKLGELRIHDSNLATAAKRSNNELFTRIKHIVNKQDNGRKRIGNPLLVIGVVLILIVSGVVFEGKRSIIRPTSLSGEMENSLSSFQGSFSFYDFQKDIYYTTDDSLSNTRYPAYSTFKIASALIALDIGIAKDESYSIQYDSLKYPLPGWMKESHFFKNWYKEHSLKTALNYSVNWYFKELGARIGKKQMALYLDKLDYGNKMIGSGNEPSWYNGELKTSASDQVEFIKNLLNQECKGVSKEAQLITKKAIPVFTEKNYSIYGKTGTGEVADNIYIGWYVGYLETGTNTYAYALNIFASDINEIPGNKRQELVKDIFTDLGLIDK